MSGAKLGWAVMAPVASTVALVFRADPDPEKFEWLNTFQASAKKLRPEPLANWENAGIPRIHLKHVRTAERIPADEKRPLQSSGYRRIAV